MQGTFESGDRYGDLDELEGVDELGELGELGGLGELGDEDWFENFNEERFGDALGDSAAISAQPDNSSMDTSAPKRSRLGANLDAMANVPWRNLAPANDRQTQQLMRDHWTQQAKYTSMVEEDREYIPKVSPYPEGPDTVFPGTPCYKISVNGRTRHVFVLDPSSNGYPAGWDGQCRPQTAARWIVPHFIYRDEGMVSLFKKRWTQVYTYNTINRIALPPKDIYNSTLAGLPVPVAGEPLLIADDSYYVAGVNNHSPAAPVIPDPVLSPPFNTNGRLNVNNMIRPYPYHQDAALFPQRIAPPPVYQQLAPAAPAAAPPAAPAAPAAAGGAGPPPAPPPPAPRPPARAAAVAAGHAIHAGAVGRGRGGGAGGGAGAAAGAAAGGGAGGAAAGGAGGAAAGGGGRGRGRGRGARPPLHQQIPPHPSLLSVVPNTSLYTGRPGVDWIELDAANNLEIGMDVLKNACEQGEERDYAFALSMQGLRGSNLNAVWACIDPEYDVTDRSMVLGQFVKTYMEKFYQHVKVASSSDVEEVVHEALRMHEEFCKGWVSRHHRTLASEITAASEALVGLFMDDLKLLVQRGANQRLNSSYITRAHMSRYLRRHPDYCGEFAYCLYHYMTSMEHMRGNRNPSYKAMNSEKAAQVTSLKKMGEMLFENGNQIKMRRDVSEVDDNRVLFDWRFVDWHYIAAQMPQHHKEFDGYASNFGMFRSRTGGRGNPFPPWQQMRRV